MKDSIIECWFHLHDFSPAILIWPDLTYVQCLYRLLKIHLEKQSIDLQCPMVVH